MAREDWLRVGEGTADEVPRGIIVIWGGILAGGGWWSGGLWGGLSSGVEVLCCASMQVSRYLMLRYLGCVVELVTSLACGRAGHVACS